MTYKDKLLNQKALAFQWVNNNIEEAHSNIGGDGERMLMCSRVPADQIEECTYLDDFEDADLDVWVVSLLISYKENTRLFKKLRFQGDGDKQSKADYDKSKADFQAMVDLVQLASSAPIDVTMPIRPRDKLYETLRMIKAAGYSEQVIDATFASVTNVKERKPKLTNVVKERDEELEMLVEMWDKFHCNNQESYDNFEGFSEDK